MKPLSILPAFAGLLLTLTACGPSGGSVPSGEVAATPAGNVTDNQTSAGDDTAGQDDSATGIDLSVTVTPAEVNVASTGDLIPIDPDQIDPSLWDDLGDDIFDFLGGLVPVGCVAISVQVTGPDSGEESCTGGCPAHCPPTGDAPPTGTVMCTVVVRIDGEIMQESTLEATPGSLLNFGFDVASLPVGEHDLEVVVDPDDAVEETDETNNRATAHIVVTAAPDGDA